MSDRDHLAGYVTCYTCGASNSVLIDMEIGGTEFDAFKLTVLKACPCGKGWEETTVAFAENETGIETPESRERWKREELERAERWKMREEVK